MGITQSTFETYRSGLTEVATKTKWKEGLLINVKGQKTLIVYRIQPLHEMTTPDNLTEIPCDMSLLLDEPEKQYMFHYVGSQVDIPPVEMTGKYAIYLKEVTHARIGGSSRHVSPHRVSTHTNTHVNSHRVSTHTNTHNIANNDTEQSPTDLIDFEKLANPDFTIGGCPCDEE
jgi:hypothetical protein